MIKSRKLLIVESPSKAKTISKYLGDNFIVKASVGHIRDLPKSNKKAVDIEDNFKPYYEISKGKEAIITELKKVAGKASEIFLATDPDREGEAIAWHIAEAVNIRNAKRVVFHEITKEAILASLEHPREIDMNLKYAQEARRVLDRLVGYDLSGLIWKKLRYGLSAGRVQSPALRIIMEREREIRSFISEKFWTITILSKTPDNKSLELFCSEEPRDFKEVKRIIDEVKSNQLIVKSVEEKEVKRHPKPPFITSTLQQAASSRLGFSPSRTMGIAQKLYEAGHISYMRTDSTTISNGAMKDIKNVIEKKFGSKYYEEKKYKTKSKNAQEAHEAIRPTKFSVESAGFNDEQIKLYKLIWKRTVASQMVPAETLRTKILVNTINNSVPDFVANGSRVISPGWLDADVAARKDDVELPSVISDDHISLVSIESEEKATEPLPRYSEAGLIKEMEKRGIGRPSTYASIIKTLSDRGYVLREKRILFPTDTGDVVSTFLENNFADYISDVFTAKVEDKLDDIANGDAEYAKILADFYTPLHKEVVAKESIEKINNLGIADASFKCPSCGSGMIIKLGKSGKFLSCDKFPDCTGGRTIDGTELEGPKPTGESCPKCKKGNLVERDGKFGRFVSCDKYPKCKFIKKDENAELNNHTGVSCPVCKKGFMTEKRGRFGVFYSCTNYPECKNAIKAKPTGNLCQYLRSEKPCGHLMMEGTKTIPERCSDKACPNHNPHKLAT